MHILSLKTNWRPIFHLLRTLTATSVICCTNREMATSQNAIESDRILRLTAVLGFDSRKNDIIFCKRQSLESAESRLIFFGGDSQDYPELMEAHRDNHRYVRWNLINTAKYLSNKFTKSDIYVIKPSQMHLKTFSCFNNFVQSNNIGAPTHNSNHNSILHLKTLISNARKIAAREMEAQGDLQTEKDLPLILVGFSKGCVVLNQIIYELHLSDSNDEVKSFVNLISEFYWLDGGHPGGSNLWITNMDLLKRLAALDVRIHVFLTPYQIEDQRRPWLKKEEKIFSDTLKRLNANVERNVFFMDAERCLEIHFELLEKF